MNYLAVNTRLSLDCAHYRPCMASLYVALINRPTGIMNTSRVSMPESCGYTGMNVTF
jgi:hypothetical protein